MHSRSHGVRLQRPAQRPGRDLTPKCRAWGSAILPARPATNPSISLPREHITAKENCHASKRRVHVLGPPDALAPRRSRARRLSRVTWDEARALAGLDWDPVTTEVYAVTSINGDGTPYLEPIAGWKSIARSDTGAVLSINRDTYTVIDHGEMGEIVEAVLAQPNVKWETAGVLDGGRSVWCLALLDEPITLPGDDSATLPYLAITNRHDGTAACALRATAVRIVCANTFRAAELEGERTGTTFSFVHKTNWRDRISEARKAVTGAQAEMRRYAELARDLLAITVTPAQRELFITQFIPKPPDGLITDRVARNVDESRSALRLLFDTPTTSPVAGTAYGLVQAAGEYLDHVRTARSWETRLNRTLIRPEPLKHRALPSPGTSSPRPKTPVPGLGECHPPARPATTHPASRKAKERLGMSNATSPRPGRVVLDWRHARIGPPAPCVLCGQPAICRSPGKDAPCHKGCAEAWITVRASRPRRLAPGSSPGTRRNTGSVRRELPGHLPPAGLPRLRLRRHQHRRRGDRRRPDRNRAHLPVLRHRLAGGLHQRLDHCQTRFLNGEPAMTSTKTRGKRDDLYSLDKYIVKMHHSAAGTAWRWRTELIVLSGLGAAVYWLSRQIGMHWAPVVAGRRARHRLQPAVVAAVHHPPVLVRAGPPPVPPAVLGGPAAHPRRTAARGPVDPPHQGGRAAVRLVPGGHLRRRLHRRIPANWPPPATPAKRGSPATPHGPRS